MRIRWRGLELPSRFERDESVSTDTYGRFTVEPFERGFGTTIGNSLRRVLLSSLEGTAVYAVKIAQVAHEFATLPGLAEDVADVILNIKQLVVDLDGDEPKTIKLFKDKAGDVIAGDIEVPTGVTVINPELKIATLTEDITLDIEMRVRRGRGYASADENAGPEQEVGVIPIDAMFSPVSRVRYRTEETRVGQRTNYDCLILEVWTRGAITPEHAVVEAGKILRKHLNPFVHYYELGDDLVTEAPPQLRTLSSAMDEQFQNLLNSSVVELQLSVRAANCLESARVRTIGELVTRSEADLLRVRSFGKTSLREVKRKLADRGLALGMTFGDDPDPPATSTQTDYVSSDDLLDADDDGDPSTPGGAGSVSIIADGPAGERN